MKKVILWMCVVVASLSIVSVFSLSGCKVESVEELTEEVGETEEEVGETEEEVGETEEEVEAKTIVFWSMYNEPEPQAAVTKEYVEGFEKINPNITVDVNFIGREILTKVVAAVGGGEAIDIICEDGSLIKGSIVKEGQALVLDEALDSSNFEDDGLWRDNFQDGILELYADEGEVSLIPYNTQSNGFFYNKTLWTANNWTVPKTWDEFLALCETIKSTTDIAPITQDMQIDFYNAFWFFQIVERLAGPGTIKAASEDQTGESWTNSFFKEAIEIERELFDKDYFIEGAEGFIWPAGQGYLASNEAAMLLMGTWSPNELKEQVDEDWEWGYFPFPEISEGIGKINDVVFRTNSWVIFKDTKVAPEAIEFLKYCTSRENGQKWSDGSTNLSPIVDVDPPKALTEPSELIASANLLYHPHDGIQTDNPEYYKNVYLKNHNLAFLGEITPNEFCEIMKQDTIEYWENQ